MLALSVLAAVSLPALPQKLLVNHTPQTRRLGLARVAFFRAVLKAGAKRRETFYAGYNEMTMIDHTTLMWPIGRADAVVFDYSFGDGALLTEWRMENGVPRRLFQIRYDEGKRAFPYGGTMAKILGKVKTSVPRRYAKPLKSLLEARQGYATYSDSINLGVYACAIVREDGSYWPGPNVGIEDWPQQSDSKVDREGFLITDEELRLMARSKAPHTRRRQ